MAQKVDEAANFIFVQLIEQVPGIYDKCHQYVGFEVFTAVTMKNATKTVLGRT
jgi:hypothetical protein